MTDFDSERSILEIWAIDKNRDQDAAVKKYLSLHPESNEEELGAIIAFARSQDHRWFYSAADLWIIGYRMTEDYGSDDAINDFLKMHPKAEQSEVVAEIEDELARPPDTRDVRSMLQRIKADAATLDDLKFFALIEHGVMQMPTYGRSVWRAPTRSKKAADDIWRSKQIGDCIKLGKTIVSFSADVDIAADWAGDAGLLVHIKSPAKGAFMTIFSQTPLEREVVLPSGLGYRVVGKREQQMLEPRFPLIRVLDLEIAEN
jgi:hypothetical protein